MDKFQFLAYCAPAMQHCFCLSRFFFCSHLFASPLSVRHHMVKPAGLGPARQQALLSITCSSAAAPVRRSPNIPQQHFCAVGGVDPAASGPPRARKFETTSASACFCQRCCQALVRFFFFTRLFSARTTTVQVPGMASTGSQGPTRKP